MLSVIADITQSQVLKGGTEIQYFTHSPLYNYSRKEGKYALDFPEEAIHRLQLNLSVFLTQIKHLDLERIQLTSTNPKGALCPPTNDSFLRKDNDLSVCL